MKKLLNTHTRLVGFDPCPGDPYRPVATPIYQTATFEQESALGFGRYDYSRSGNPTRAVLEELVAELEGAERGFAFASGLAAMTAVTRLLSAGDEIVAGDDLYGGAYRLFSKILARTGITVRYADATDPAALAAAMGPRTRLVHVETPTNPRLRIVDIAAVAEVAHRGGAVLSVDNTAMSPYLQNPLALGADVVMHSATKYLCGHSDVTAGVVATSDAKLAETLYLIQNGEGSALGPFDSFLLLRGLRTLGLRMDRQQASAQKVAEFLAGHPDVERVWFPGLDGHPGADIHARQARGPGAVISFQTGSLEVSRRVAEASKLFAITVSFGGIGSSISVPCRMSHASIPAEVQKKVELPEDLVRVSVGIEDAGDLIEDLGRALEAARGVAREAVVA